ncbi:DUF6473 family protein [Rubellimicrobium roseum]|uniref:DUF6473 domain-containing protein n=1 Tax=Rubellimicrobium roseum TaxID=687525 RepID=A0A5C4NIY8_9RHOB|nr:DUF6473 family protein [Rubellimicrobium roseum]TNC74072.1 hypothetical protein FHG71_02405 [Rubellimicrobium roseum]
MKHDKFLGVEPGRPVRPALRFRDPERRPPGGHVVFLGGAETRGEVLERPFPALVETALGVPCLNLGVAQASAEAFLADPEVVGTCRGAALTVIEVMGAANLSNRLYAVHPRRNDRFLRALPALEAIVPGVDLCGVCFTRHLLRELRAAAPDRFDLVREELRLAWRARMRTLIERVGGPVLLLRLPPEEGDPVLGPDPLFVTDAMVEALRPWVAGIVEVPAGAGRWTPEEREAAAHREVAAALVGPVRAALAAQERVRASRSAPGRR